jgi:hypothetical protein
VGDVTTNYSIFAYGPSLILGNTEGGAILSVNGGSWFTQIDNSGLGELYLGGVPQAYGTPTDVNSVMVSGTNSYLQCWGIAIGSLGGYFNSVSVSDGAMLRLGGIGASGTNTTILVTNLGSVLQCDQGNGIALDGDYGSVRVEGGGQLLGNIKSSGANEVLVISGTNSAVSGAITTRASQNCSVIIKDGAQVNDLGLGLGDIGYYAGSNNFSIDGQGTYVKVNGDFWFFESNDQLRISGGAKVDANANFEIGYYGTNVVATVTDPGTHLTVSGGYVDQIGRPAPAFLIEGFGNTSSTSGCTLIISNSATVTAACNILLGCLCDGGSGGNNLCVTGEGSQLLVLDGSIWLGRVPDYTFTAIGLSNQLSIAAGGLAAAANVEIFSGNSAVVEGTLFVTNSSQTSVLYIEGALTITGTVQADLIAWPGGGSFTSGLLLARNANVNNGLPFTVGDGTNAATYAMQGGTHTFASGLVISSNSVLSGCGTVSGSVTNYGTIMVTNGCDMVFSNSVVNFGVIIATNGTPRFLSTFENHGTLIATPPVITLSAPLLAGGQV